MARILTAIIKEPGRAPEIVEIPDELENYQGIVDGYIECVRWDDEHVLIVNEEGKLRGLDKNFRYGGDIIVGTAIWVGVDGEDFTDIQPGLVDEVMDFTGFHRYDLDDDWEEKLKKVLGCVTVDNADLEDLIQTALAGEPYR